MIKNTITAIVLSFLLTNSFAQSVIKDATVFHTKAIEETIGEKYILLPVDSNKKDFSAYLHVWPNPTADNLVNANEGGKTIVTLKSVVSGSHANLADTSGMIYNQYFSNGKDELLYFMPLTDYQKARAFINKTLWFKVNKKQVKILDVQLTPDHNAPLLLTLEYTNGKRDSVKTVLSGTNSTIKDESIIFYNQFYINKPK